MTGIAQRNDFGESILQTKVDAVKPAYTIIPGNDARLDAIKQELRGLEDKEAASRRELEVLSLLALLVQKYNY
jgi:hypothetical protein